MSDEPVYDARLFSGLLAGDRELYRLYANSPEFHASIDLIVRLLPPVVRVLADEARKAMGARTLMESFLDGTLLPDLED